MKETSTSAAKSTSLSMKVKVPELNGISKFLHMLKRDHVHEFEVFLLGLCIVLGAQNNGWNVGLSGGFWVMFFELTFLGIGYICLCLCMAEMSSALPFSGGIFGFVRASAGPFCGYLVACTELLLNTVYVALMVVPIAKLPYFLGLIEESKEPAVLFGIYSFLLIICCTGGKPFWTMNALLGLSSLFIIVIYLCGSTSEIGSGLANFNKFCASSIPFTAANALGLRSAGAHQFRGVQYMPLASHNLKDPKTQLPRMMLLTIAILCVSALSLAFAACSQAPGIADLALRPYPLDYGFASMLHRSLEVGAWLHLPGMLASAFGFFYCYGRQLHSISESGLLPKIFATTIPVLETPYVAQCFGAVICFCVNLWIFYQPAMLFNFQNIATLSLLTVILFAFAAFLLFRIKFSTMQRQFTNPIGIFCVVYGFLDHGAGFISIIFFRGKDYIPITTLLVYLTLATIFYVLYMSKHQTFSEEEKKHLFKAYLINANLLTKKKLIKKNKVGVAGAGAGGAVSRTSDPSAHSHSNTHTKAPTFTKPSQLEMGPIGGAGGIDLDKMSPRTDILDASNKTPSHAVNFHTPQDTLNQQSFSARPDSIDMVHHSHANGVVERSSHSSMSQRKGNLPMNPPAERVCSSSAKWLHFLNSKMNAVVPHIELATSSFALNNDYQRLAVMASGGQLEEKELLELEHQLGIEPEQLSMKESV